MIKRIGKPILMMLPEPVRMPLQFRIQAGYWPRMAHPQTFNEKIQYRKRHWRNPLFVTCADKAAVKPYVDEILGEGFTIPTLYVGESISHADIVSLIHDYSSIALKTTHGSGVVFFLNRDSSESEIADALHGLSRDLQRDFGRYGYETWYSHIRPQVIVEPDISSQIDALPDYKFHVFAQAGASKPQIVLQVDYDRFTGHTRNMYDEHGRKLDFGVLEPRNDSVVTEEAPDLISLTNIARQLAEPFGYVRVDLYRGPDGPQFGELTFAHGSGFQRFTPLEYDTWMGSLWTSDPTV